MSKGVDDNTSPAIAQAFSSDCVVVSIASILPVKAIEKTTKSSHKYRQIAASIREIGLVEPPVVIRDAGDTNSYLLLDGHLRIEVLRDLGQTEVECLVSTDDEAFTYNKRISRLSPVQEQRMIAKAIERNVPRDKIARALDINVRSISRKVQLLDGICEEAVGLLKDKMCPLAVFDVLRKMNALRQIEAAELLINANNFSISYASAILAGTPQAQLVTPQTPKRLKGMTAEAIARMERELSRLQEAISSIQDSYGQDHLHLTVVKGYLRKLITNDRVARYLEQYQPELFIEFQKIAEMTSTLPSEAA
jgi:RepB plasmid partitioning protein/ParB-like nuclease domain